METKRYRAPKAMPGELKIAYGKNEGDVDLFYCHGGAGAVKADSRMLCHFFERVFVDDRNLRQELERRGYDITTLKLSIMKK